MRWNHFCHHIYEDKEKRKKTFYPTDTILTIIYDPWLWTHFLWGQDGGGVTCTQDTAVKWQPGALIQTQVWVNSEVQFSTLVYITYPQIQEVLEGVSLKSVSGDHRHTVQRSPTSGSAVSYENTCFCFLVSSSLGTWHTSLRKRRLEAKQGKLSTVLHRSSFL